MLDLGLDQRFVEGVLVLHPDGMVVIEEFWIGMEGFAARFRFDGKNAGRTNKDMVFTETRPMMS